MKTFALPLVAVILVACVLGVQVAAGGDDYVPHRPADPCVPRPIPPLPAKLEPLAERIVLLGLDGAACREHISRERLVFMLADNRTTDSTALKAGLHDAVNRLDREHRLPKVSQLRPEVLAQANLPGFAKTIINAVPASIVDSALPTAAVLNRAIDQLDVAKLIKELDDPDKLQAAVQAAILKAARDQILQSLR